MRHWMLGALVAAAIVGPAPAAETVSAKVESGALAGEVDDGVAVFRAVPFAAPPVGPLRWAPPQKPLAWSGVRAATANGPSCVQTMNADGKPNGGGASGPVSEDCLTLNVFAPKGAKKAPVMVWIYGGANVVGTSNIYDGHAFARDGVILVAINYRLGPFGFFAHPALTRGAKADEPLANYALMDQMAGLQWVRRNVKAFGGDPDNVTVFGESAGAMDIVALLGIPAAKGLFDRAIMESNIGWGTAQTLAASETQGAALATKVGLPGADATADQLRAVPADKILAAAGRGAGTTIDGRMVKESAGDAFAAGRGLNVPIIIGSNSYEASLAAGAGRAPLAPAMADTFTNSLAGAPARWIAGRFAAGAPAWLYFFSYVREADRAKAPGAAHASEIPYVYNRPMFARTDPPSQADQGVATLMHSCWVAFAKTGTPKCASGPAWPAYTPDGDQLMEFGVDSGVRTHFRKAALDALDQNRTRPPAPPRPQ